MYERIKDTMKAYIFGKVILCSTLRLWVGYFIYFKFRPVFFYLIFLKGISQLISKGMLNIYLKVTIKKNWRS